MRYGARNRVKANVPGVVKDLSSEAEFEGASKGGML